MDLDEADGGEWWAAVQRSDLDERVWIAILPGHDHATNMNASTSRRRCQRYAYGVVEAHAYGFDPAELKWVHDKVNDRWVLVL